MRINALFQKAYLALFFGVLSFLVLLAGAESGYAQEDLTALGASPEQFALSEVDDSESEGSIEGEQSLDMEEDSMLADSALIREATTKYTVTPMVANEKAKPRDIIKKELLVTNNTGQRIDLYISVENIDPTDGALDFASPAVSDLSTSLANWIEITRGVIELAAGESKKIPYLIHVNLSAKPGSYFARIQFREGARRSEAESKEDGTSLMLNLEVLDDAKEHLQLGNFISEDSLVLGRNVSFSYLLENVGNRSVEPRGSIRIFNRRGEEVGSIPLNAEGEEINPNNRSQLAAAWSAEGRFGKYKAFLDLEYGENQLASVQDTLYFWVFPWKEVLATLFGVLVLAIIGTYIIHMRAVARPVPARAQVAREPDADSFESHYEPSPVAPQYSPQRSTAGGPTVLVGRPRQVAATSGAQQPVSETVAPVRQGATVELTPQSRNSRPVQHGNTVQLAPRR